jgi:hypothetical protein
MRDPSFTLVTLAIAVVTASCEPAQTASPRPPVERPAPEPTASVALPPVTPAAADSGTARSPTDAGAIPSNAEDVIRRQIHPGAKRCFQRALEMDPTQAGRIVIKVRIDDSGAVAEAHVVSNLGMSTDVGECIASVARRAVFASPGPEGATINIPFRLETMTTPRADAGP